MAIGKVLPKTSFVMRIHQASSKHPENGEEIDVSLAGASPVITYKGRMVIWDIQEIIAEAVELVEKEEAEKNG